MVYVHLCNCALHPLNWDQDKTFPGLGQADVYMQFDYNILKQLLFNILFILLILGYVYAYCDPIRIVEYTNSKYVFFNEKVKLHICITGIMCQMGTNINGN